MAKDQGFEISKIKQVPPMSVENLATGEYAVEQQGVRPNAEVEDKEYLQYPNGEVQQAIGPTHEKGGIKMNLPHNTKVLSDTLTLTRNDVKNLSSQYDLKFSTNDTYAKAVDKVTKKLGLTKINNEQKDIFELLKKQQQNPSDVPGTNRVNIEYLNNKIYNLEQSKKPLEAERSKFFDHVFNLQESNKPKPKAEEQHFKYGGLSKDAFMRMCEKHGLTEEQGLSLMPKYGFGGLTGEAADELSKKWNGRQDLYDDYLAAKEKINSPEFKQKLHEHFKNIISNDAYYGQKNKDVFKKSLASMTPDQVAEELLAQEERNARLEAHGLGYHKDQATAPGHNVNKTALELLNREGLSDLKDKFKEGYKGQAAYLAYNSLLNGDKAHTKDYKVNPNGQADEEINGRRSNISKIDNASTDTTLLQRLGIKAAPKKAETPEEKSNPGTPIKDFQAPHMNLRGAGFYAQPQELIPAPNRQFPAYMGMDTTKLMSPEQIGITQLLQNNAGQNQTVDRQIQDLTPGAKAAFMAAFRGQQGEQLNNSIVATNIANSQNRMNAEQYNLAAADSQNNKNNIFRGQFVNDTRDNLNTDRHNLMGYIQALNNRHINNWEYNQKMNQTLAMNPDMNVNPLTGMPYYDPQYTYQIQNRDDINRNITTT